jgi:hypothetical protein
MKGVYTDEWEYESELASLNYWRLCDELTVMQAALLIVSEDPSKNEHIENWKMEERPHGYEAAKTAISNALRKGSIKGKLIPFYEIEINGNSCGEILDSIDIKESRVDVESLRTWLRSRGVKTGFFFPTTSDYQDYLNPEHPRYAPKLAAAVQAWLAVGENAGKDGKSVKQSLLKWLREHAAIYKLSDDDGKPNETGIEECAKVANWQDKGGAPKTPNR